MGLLDIANMLRSYAGSDVSAPPPNAQQDFAQAAQHAPPEHLASGLTAAFQSNQTPPFPQMLSQLFGQSNGQQRAGILSELLSTAGPTLGGGLLQQFSGFLHGGTVTPEQAQQVAPEAVQQLAAHAQQQDPSVVERAGNFYAQHPQLVQALGAGALALIMSHLSERL
ncbi:MAG: hypothetical protein WA324_22545 [Bryobacteraceae bacterium]